MRVNIFGLGYVGCVTAACLANEGHDVLGIDVDEIKVASINNARSPIVEPGLDLAIKTAVDTGKLTASTSISQDNFSDSHVSFLCVGTPSKENGSLDLKYIESVSEEIGTIIRTSSAYHVINIRSTVLPGTTEEIILPALEKYSGKKVGDNFGICMNPEFMREGTSIDDFFDPPFTVIGEFDNKSGDTIAPLYVNISGETIRTSIKAAEMVKYACNSFHALKVVFANEIGNICKKLKIDSHEVMNIFTKDKKLNISSYYLKPGFAFGGSCLPKDIRALLHRTKELDTECNVLNSIIPSNNNQIDMAFELIRKTNLKKIGILGLSFKPDTDDLRESPMVELSEKLLGKGFHLSIYDKEVSLAKIFGSNKEYIETIIPHISTLLKDSIKEVISNSQVIVCCKFDKEYIAALEKMNAGKIIIDLARIFDQIPGEDFTYEGICW